MYTYDGYNNRENAVPAEDHTEKYFEMNIKHVLDIPLEFREDYS